MRTRKIDSYIGVRHAVPLSPVPDIIRDCSVDLSLLRLYSRRQGPPEHIADQAKRRVDWLKNVSVGKATLGQNDPGGTPPSSKVDIASSPRIFSRDTMGGF